MADTKNYGLKGVGDDVQFGKGGGRFVYNTGASDFRATTDGTTLAHLQVLDPVGDTDAATKLYVDSTAQGLDAKESARLATTATTGTYTNNAGPLSNGQLTSATTTIDGVAITEGDRILVKDHSTAAANGIYVVTATTSTWNRAADFDEDDEVTAGAYVFIEEGSTNANSGWVLQGPDPLTVGGAGGSDLNFVLFSASSDILAGNGLVKNGNTLDLDFSELTSATTIALADEIIFQDGGTVESRITLTNLLHDRDIPYGVTDGLITRTANDTYASRSIAVSGAGAEDGLTVTNGDGVSGNPTIGLDIVGTTNLVTDAIDDADEFIMYHSVGTGSEVVGNYAVTATKLKDYVTSGLSTTSISDGNSSVVVSDPATGTITTTVDGTAVITSVAASTSFNHNVIVTTGDTLTLADLTENDVMIVGASGVVEDSGGLLTFDGTTLAVTGALTVDEVTIDGDTISNNTLNQPLILRPNGTGSIIFQNGSSEEILELNDTASAVNGLAITAGATGVAPTIALGTGSETNVDIGFVTNGTGVLSVTAGTGNYEDNVTAEDDIPNKKYVDDAVAAGVGLTGNVDTVTGTVDLTTDGAQNIGPAAGIPAGATVLSVLLDVTTISDNGSTTTVTVGRSGAAASYMAATENDCGVAGIYIADGRVVEGSAQQATATVASSATTTGSATCIITFRHA